MRLLHASTRKLEEFIGSVPQYAILSHTWGDDEVSFRDLMSNPKVEDMKGYRKIRLTCDQALKDGIKYAWCDTCCIDKSSSAELSECINSMWLYYRNARICYAYIDDVSNDSHPAPDTLDQLFHEELRGSRWFTRAWTLQELIAPSNLTFYNVSWTQIGSRDRDLLQLIYEVTKIPKDILSAEYKLEARLKQCSIAKRMSWAAERRSRRPEDRAYSLMGIFAINMPMLYGEGTKAFVRLQEEIIKTSTDHSILVHANLGRGALFASGPSEFLHASNIDACDPNEPTESYSMTNRGLIITLPIITNIPPRPGTKVRPKIVAALNCREKGDARMILLIQSTLPPAGSRLPLEYSIVGNLGTTAVRTREEDKRTIVIIRECLPKFD